jgi:hypothetical protein
VHSEVWVPADEDACRARVVEVDVTEQQMAEVGERHPVLGETALERVDAARGPAVEERRAIVALEEVAADDAFGAFVMEVD